MLNVARGAIAQFPTKAAEILNGVSVLQIDGRCYSRFVAKVAETDRFVVSKLLEMGLRAETIRPKLIRSLGAYGDIFTPQGKLNETCVQGITDSVYRLGAAPNDMPILEYLLNPRAWRPKLMNIFGVQEERLPQHASIKIDEGSLDIYSEAELKARGVFNPSDEYLSAAARTINEVIDGLRKTIVFFKNQGQDTSATEAVLAERIARRDRLILEDERLRKFIQST